MNTNEVIQLSQSPALLNGINMTHALLAVIAGWVTHVNWPRIVAVGTWAANNGGLVGIVRKVVVGNPQPRPAGATTDSQAPLANSQPK